MSEFQRQPDADNIFENNELITIILRHNDDQQSRYDNNPDNYIAFLELREILEKLSKNTELKGL